MSQYDYAYTYSVTLEKTTFEKAKKVKLKKLSNTEAVEKSVAYTKSISSLVFSWDLIHSKW